MQSRISLFAERFTELGVSESTTSAHKRGKQFVREKGRGLGLEVYIGNQLRITHHHDDQCTNQACLIPTHRLRVQPGVSNHFYLVPRSRSSLPCTCNNSRACRVLTSMPLVVNTFAGSSESHQLSSPSNHPS